MPASLHACAGDNAPALPAAAGSTPAQEPGDAADAQRRLANVSDTLRRLQRQEHGGSGEDEGPAGGASSDEGEGQEEDGEEAGSSGSDGEGEEEDGGASDRAMAAGPCSQVSAAAGGALVDPDDDAAMCEHLFNGLVFFLG